MPATPIKKSIANRRTQYALSLALMFSVMASANAAETKPKNVASPVPTDAERIREIDQWLSAQFKPEAPGAVVIISQHGKPLLKKAYGLSNVEKKTPLATSDVMRIASTTKPFTAMAILLLEEEGKLSVNDDITRHLPSYPTNGHKITIAHLLSHTSGLGVYTESLKLREIIRDDMTSADVMKLIESLPPNSAPGLVTDYNNSGFYILGALIEKVSGMSYADFMKKRIFAPLKLTNTALEYAPEAPALIANYRVQNGVFTAAPKMNAMMAFSAGGIVSSADDIERFVAAVENRKLLKPATWQRAMTASTLANGSSTEYGYSWRLRKLRGADVIEHGGNTTGFQSQLMMFPKEQLSLIVMTNHQPRHNLVRHVSERIAAMAINRPLPDLKVVELSEAALDKFVGTYNAKDVPSRTITRVGKQLRQTVGRTQVMLDAYGENVFFQPDTSFTRYRFVLNKAGEATEMVRIDVSDEEQVFTKTPNPTQGNALPKP